MYVYKYMHVCMSVCMHEYVYGYANVRRWVITGDEGQGKRGARSRQRRDASYRLPRIRSAGWLLLSGGVTVCVYMCSGCTAFFLVWISVLAAEL